MLGADREDEDNEEEYDDQSYDTTQSGEYKYLDVPGNERGDHPFNYVHDTDPLPDEANTVEVDREYGDGMMQGSNGVYNDLFIYPCLKLVERIDACKRSAQLHWDNMIIYSEDHSEAESNMALFLSMQNNISRDRLLLLRGMFNVLRGTNYNGNWKEFFSLPDILELQNVDKTASSVTLSRYRENITLGNERDGQLTETHPSISMQIKLEWDIAHRLYHEQDPHHTLVTIRKILGALQPLMDSSNHEIHSHTKSAYRGYCVKDQWEHRVNGDNTSLNMPMWSYPRDSRIGAASWKCAGDNDEDYMEIIAEVASLSIFKKYYNPRVVEVVKRYVNKVSMQALLDEDIDGLTNCILITVKMRVSDRVYSLAIHPMNTHDSCLVSNLLLKQNIDLDRSVSGGIIVIPNNMDTIQTVIDDMNVEPIQSYLVPGAYKGGKLTEEKIIGIHAKACASLMEDMEVLWDPVVDNLEYHFKTPEHTDISWEHLPKAKVVRISKGGWDVVASSHLTSFTTMETVISVVKYPAYGTQIEPKRLYSEVAAARVHPQVVPPPPQGNPHHRASLFPEPSRYRYEYPSNAQQPYVNHQDPGRLPIQLHENFFIRGLFEEYIDVDEHLVHASWREVSDDEKQSVMDEFAGYFRDVKRMISQTIRDEINQGGDRQTELESYTRNGKSSFFLFLMDNEIHRQYRNVWYLFIREFLDKYASSGEEGKEGEEGEEGDQDTELFFNIPLVFTTETETEREEFLNQLFPSQNELAKRQAYQKLMEEEGLYVAPDDESDKPRRRRRGVTIYHGGR
jgi:hypothetical protein